mgnify:CR=1 FL=1
MIYEVTWSFDLVAEDHEQAAKQAYALIREPDNKLTVFNVRDLRTGIERIVDVERLKSKT